MFSKTCILSPLMAVVGGMLWATVTTAAPPIAPKFANLTLVTPGARAGQNAAPSYDPSNPPDLPTQIPPLASTEYLAAVATHDYLSEVEQQIVAETNRLRAEPALYAAELENLRQYFDGYLLRLPGFPPLETVEGVAAVEEAIAALRETAPLPRLTPSWGMSQAARDHVQDLGAIGADGHYGSDGSTPFDRLNRYGSWEVGSSSRAGENLSYSPINLARWHILQWVVDDGVPNRGHRQAILRPDYQLTGIACGAHTFYGTMCSMTYAKDYIEAESLF